ncbi:MAG: NAD/FAD-utilizing enzyme [Spongiibacteraceae bacterium]|jgi:hypothetical protein|nr:NAD/FAD-utilizing enzyme [Spongiibacteraceae bacterium]
MKRYYFVSDRIEDLKRAEQELMRRGIARQHIHVLSDDDAKVEVHGMQPVSSPLKKDVIRSGERGAVIGLVGAALIIAVAWLLGASTIAVWVPVIFLAIVVLGFGTWEGGFIGIQRRNRQHTQFDSNLAAGEHVLMVDADTDEEPVVPEVIAHYQTLRPAGDSTQPTRLH